MLGYLSDETGCILSDNLILVFEQREYLREDVIIDDLLGQFLSMLGNLSQTGADLSLQLRVFVNDQISKEWNGSLIDQFLGHLGIMLADLRQSRSRDLL